MAPGWERHIEGPQKAREALRLPGSQLVDLPKGLQDAVEIPGCLTSSERHRVRFWKVLLLSAEISEQILVSLRKRTWKMLF